MLSTLQMTTIPAVARRGHSGSIRLLGQDRMNEALLHRVVAKILVVVTPVVTSEMRRGKISEPVHWDWPMEFLVR